MHRIEGDNVIVEDGKNQFTETPPATIITAKIMNAIQEEICKVIEDAGISVKTADGDTFDQLSTAIALRSTEYDYIVTNQSQWNAIIERVGANQYKIIDDYHSIYVKYVLGGYACAGGNSFLSGGDSYGYIETNNCANLVFEAGAYLGFGANPGYIEVNTDDCYLKNVSVRGSGSVGAITQSFLLNALRVKYDHCSTSNRNSSIDFVGFQGSGTALHNYTSSYDGCSVYTIDGSDKVYGFKDAHNLHNCITYDLDNTVDTNQGFYTCYNLNGCIAYDIDSTTSYAYGFRLCEMLNNCKADSISADNGNTYGYVDCDNLSSCIASNISSKVTIGFSTCGNMSACKAVTIDSSGASTADGFFECAQISACVADDIDSVNGDAHGFQTCSKISACTASDIDSSGGTAYGFKDCTYGAAISTLETCSGNTFINADTNEYSCPVGLTP